MHSRSFMYYRLIGILLIVGFIFAAIPAAEVQAGTPEDTLFVSNWDTTAGVGVTGRPTVVFDGTLYHLWYGPTDGELYHTTSSDPTSFASGTLTTFDSTPYEVASPAIIYEGSTFYMVAYKPADKMVFSLYSSSDGNSWVYENDVFDGSVLTDINKVDAPSLFKDGSVYRLYFQVKSADTTNYKIYTAESDTLSNVFTLTNSGNPVLVPGSSGTWDSNYVMHPWVIKDNGMYFMYYSAYGTTQRIGLAKSADGYTWVKSPGNPVIGQTGEPVVIINDGAWQMWYLTSGGVINYISANGPIEFSSIQSAIDAASDGDTVTIASGTYVENPTNGTISPEVLGKKINILGAVNPSGEPTTTIQGTITVSLDSSMDDNIRIENINFIEVDSTNGIDLFGVNGGTISNCTFTGSGYTSEGNGIRLANGSSNGNSLVTVENSTFTGGYNSAIQGYISGLTILDSTILNTRSGVNLQGGGNLVVQDTDISIVAQSAADNHYGIRFASSTATNMTISGGRINIDRNGLIPEAGKYHSAIIVRSPAAGTLEAEGTAILGEVVNLSTTELDLSPNWWGFATGPAADTFSADSIGAISYIPWCTNPECTTFGPVAPTLTTVSPNNVRAGSDGFTLTVNGSGFEDGATVYWDGLARVTTFVSSTQLTAVIGAEDVTAVDAAQITVENPSSDASNALQVNVYTFADVLPSAWYWRWVEGFYAQGITTGCAANPLGYCPERAVTRAEMAVFILRAKNGTATPTPTSTGMFADVPVMYKEWMQPWIEQFYNEGITTGCAAGPLQYCPERQVTRAEMAVFVLRAIHGPDYVPPAATGVFSDVPVAGKEWMQPWIEQFYNEGITTGCASSPLRYCPEQSVTRAEMATFIDRAFGYPQLP